MEIENVDEKVETELRKYLAGAGAAWRTGIAAYYIWYTTGGGYGGYTTGAAPCHHYLRDMPGTADAIMVNAMKPSISGKHKDFVLWVCQESPYAYAVLNRDNPEELLNNGMVIDIRKCGKGGALWLCKALRMLSERPDKADKWQTLMNEGLDPLLAFCGASMLTSAGAPETGGHHCSLFYYNNPEQIKKRLDELRKGEKNTTERAALGYTGCNVAIWGSMGQKITRKPDGWGGYVDVAEPGDAKSYAKLLLKIDAEGKLS